jgi:hypothetical protein
LKPARTILAVLLGFFVWLAVIIVGGLFFASAAAHAGSSQLMITGEIVSFVAGVAAGVAAAAIAVERPVLHAGVLGIVMICVLFFAAASARRPLVGVPPWYPYAAALLTGAGAFVGGTLANRPRRSQ